MLKTEVICESCDSHHIVVSQDDQEPMYCSFCQAALAEADDQEEE